MIKALIVDDKNNNREVLMELVKVNCPEIEVCWVAGSVKEALEIIETNFPQLIFLDVELNDGTGFDILRKSNNRNYKVIFVTGFSHYAIKAIRFSALDYLLKPVDVDDLKQAVEKAVSEFSSTLNSHSHKELFEILDNPTRCKLAIPVREGFVYIDTDNIIRMEADGAYTNIICTNEKHFSSKNIKELEMLLTGNSFFRCHRSHLINLKMVKKFDKTDGYFLQMNDGSIAEVSRRKKEEFLVLMSNLK